MMSPDPPRDRNPSSSNSDGGLPPEGFIAVWDDEDDFFGDGPYELDIGGSGDESEFSESGGEDEGRRNSNVPPVFQNSNDDDPSNISNAEGEGNRARGHYQLLIPFPPSEVVGSDSEEQSGRNENESVQNNDDLAEDVISAIASFDNSSSSHQEKRDISLPQENVELIKSAMKNFSLPSGAIPSWASELNDDALKNRLTECIDSKKESN